jgi:2-polyprenyl-6-methoxyphenol hydroxylase-like FAD-dependent oxidoreductase
MLAQEDDQWIVTLVAHFGNNAPAEIGGFIEFARTLAAPYIYDVVQNAEPVGDAATTRFPASVCRRYDKLGRFPQGFLVFVDAISSFNPRYGQGMSVAALQALELREVLGELGQDLASRFFRRSAKVIEIPWTIAASNDLRLKEVRGRRSAASSLRNWYMSRLQRAAHGDDRLAVAFHRVSNLLAVPQSLMRPSIAWRVLPATCPGSHGWPAATGRQQR